MSRHIRSFGMIWVLTFFVFYVLYGSVIFEPMLMSMVLGIAIIIFGQDNNK